MESIGGSFFHVHEPVKRRWKNGIQTGAMGRSEEKVPPEIRMAKEMGLNPKSLIKNIPNPKEQWKLPVKDWIHEMYEDRQRKQKKKAAAGKQAPT